MPCTKPSSPTAYAKAAVVSPWPQPISATEAKFSIPYAVSVAFVDGVVSLGSFDEAHLNDERIRQFASKLQATTVRGWGREHAASGRLAIGLTDGTWSEIEVIEALGTPNRAMSDQSLVEKFTNCTGWAAHPITPAGAAAVAEVILRERQDIPVASIFDFLSGPLVDTK